MKAILISIKPQWVAKILNGEKTIEIRKRFPKDYRGWVYIYCTKNLKNGKQALTWLNEKSLAKAKTITYYGKEVLGKVVARFYCDNVRHFEYETCSRDISGYWLDNGEVFNFKKTCLTYEELFHYIKSGDGYAIPIDKLEIFDRPKELSEFLVKVFPNRKDNLFTRELTKAPQSWCYIESED